MGVVLRFSPLLPESGENKYAGMLAWEEGIFKYVFM